MVFFLTPRFAPAYNSCSPFGCAPAPQRIIYRQSRPSFPSFVPFLAQVDELLGELDREARRHAAHQARQQRKRAIRAKFSVHENEEGWEVQGEVPGFDQENIQIEVSDEQTLKISGNTEHRIEQEAAPAPAAAASEAEKTAKGDTDMDGVTITEADLQEQERAASPAGSDTESHKSYQATVEDDFEDLGAETSSTVSAASEPKESKGKERAVEESDTVQSDPQPEARAEQQQQQQQQQEEERSHGSFEQTFKFPVRIDAGNVRAALKDGVLSVSVPKAPAYEVRQIGIQ